MEKEYLVTFKSTTAALRAKMLIDKEKNLEPLRASAEVVPVPFSLSETCFGMGIRFKCKADNTAARALMNLMKERQVDYKRFWLIGKEYTQCNQELERSAS